MSTYRRPMTYAEERSVEMREFDVPLVGQFSEGDRVVVDRAWLRHWTFRNSPKPTQFLWKKLITEGGGVVEKTDDHGNVWVLDHYGRYFGGGSFPVPARFVHPKGAEMGARKRPRDHKPFKVDVIADDSGEWVGNELRFKTHEEAEQYAKDLFSRWTAMREWRVVKEGAPQMGIAYPPARRQREAGYDLDLPSMPPFMYVEGHRKLGDLGIIAYGAYNAMGLIGTEKGGVAVVIEEPEKAVLATKDIPWDPDARAAEAQEVIKLISGMLRSSGREGKRVKIFPAERRDEFVHLLREAGYDVRAE